MKIQIRYKKKGRDDRFIYRVILFGNRIFLSTEIPAISITDERANEKKKKKTFTIHEFMNIWLQYRYCKNHTVGYSKLINQLSSDLKVNQFEWRTAIGLIEPVHTAIASAAIESMKNVMFALVFYKIKKEGNIIIDVVPHYNTLEFSVHFYLELYISNIKAFKNILRFTWMLIRQPLMALQWLKLMKRIIAYL